MGGQAWACRTGRNYGHHPNPCQVFVTVWFVVADRSDTLPHAGRTGASPSARSTSRRGGESGSSHGLSLGCLSNWVRCPQNKRIDRSLFFFNSLLFKVYYINYAITVVPIIPPLPHHPLPPFPPAIPP